LGFAFCGDRLLLSATQIKDPPEKGGLAFPFEEQDACFVVRDHGGQALAYVYFEDEQ
jgi:hypothetical protein